MRIVVAGLPLKCSHCGGAEFKPSRAQLHTALTMLFDVAWLNRAAQLYCCETCGRIEWFVAGAQARMDEPEPVSECLECGETIASNETACPKCGWTYR